MHKFRRVALCAGLALLAGCEDYPQYLLDHIVITGVVSAAEGCRITVDGKEYRSREAGFEQRIAANEPKASPVWDATCFVAEAPRGLVAISVPGVSHGAPVAGVYRMEAYEEGAYDRVGERIAIASISLWEAPAADPGVYLVPKSGTLIVQNADSAAFRATFIMVARRRRDRV